MAGSPPANLPLLVTSSRFPSGVWFDELVPLADAGLVVSQIARVVGIEGRRVPLIDAFVATLRDAQLLFVLGRSPGR